MNTNQTKIEFGFGVELTKDQTRINPDAVPELLGFVRDLVLTHFDGCAFTRTEGAWRNPAGHTYVERGYTLMILTDAAESPRLFNAVNKIVAEIKFLFQQEAVAVTLTPVNFSIL